MPPNNIELKLFSGRASEKLAQKIAYHINRIYEERAREKNGGILPSDYKPFKLGNVKVTVFKDGEIQPSFEETIRGDYVFIVQSTFAPAENLMELLLMIDAAFRASAYKIVAVIPYFGYARQDRKDKPRVSIGAKLVANMLHAAGVSRVMTMDLHADQIQGFFDVPVDHLFASNVFVPYIQKLMKQGVIDPDRLVVAAPDTGGVKRANAYSKFLHSQLVICHKTRPKPNEVEEIRVIGDVKDKDVVLVDDIIDTAGTVTKAAKQMKLEGARKVFVFASHPVLSGDAYDNIENSVIDKVFVTDSIPLRRESEKIEVISIAEMFAKVIVNVYEQQSISEAFIQK